MKVDNYGLAGLALSALLLLGGCGGGGGGGGGGAGIPTATNPAITPPSAIAKAISADLSARGENGTISAAVFEAVDGADDTTSFAQDLFLVGVQTNDSTTTRAQWNLVNIVQREMTKIKDHQLSAPVTGVQIVNTFPCFVSGTETIVFDDQTANSSSIFVNCDNGGAIIHGTLSTVVTNFAGDVNNFVLNATLTIDLSIKITGVTPSDELVTQGSVSVHAEFAGSTLSITMTDATLLSSVNGVAQQMINLNLIVADDGAERTVTTNGSFTLASDAIGGSVTVAITQPIVFVGLSDRPSSGQITITGTPGQIVLTVVSEVAGVQIDVTTGTASDSFSLSWDAFEALI